MELVETMKVNSVDVDPQQTQTPVPDASTQPLPAHVAEEGASPAPGPQAEDGAVVETGAPKGLAAVVAAAAEAAAEGAEDDEAEKEFVMPELEVTISPNGMLAYLRFESAVPLEIPIDKEEIRAKLLAKGVVFGISDEEFDNFCEVRTSLQRHRIAQGKRPVDGEDGSYKLNFEVNRGKPQEMEDGKVDFKELGLIHNVEEGELLCTITLPTDGEDGRDIYGKLVPAQAGREALIKPGKFVDISEDGTEMRAQVDGSVHFERNTVIVDESRRIRGDVGPSTGHVDFNGSISIDGNVLDGYNVTAKKDIFVRGRVEGASLSAGGNIVIAAGIAGMNRTVIRAGGDVTAKFIENAEEVRAGGNLYADIIIRSVVKAEKSILMKGSKGTIIGGSALAGERIVAKALGSDLWLDQDVTIRKDWPLYETDGEDDEDEDDEAAALEQQDSTGMLEEKLQVAQGHLDNFTSKLAEQHSLGPDKDIKLVREYMIKKSQAASVVASLKMMLAQREEEEHLTFIVCKGKVYPGVKIRIDHYRMSIFDEVQNQKFYVHDGEVVLGQILPGDADI